MHPGPERGRLEVAVIRVPPGRLPAGRADEVLAAARQAEQSDEIPPLNDDQLIALEHPGAAEDTLVHLIAGYSSGGDLAGYAQLELQGGGAVGTLFVVPDERGQGVGRRLSDQVLAQSAADVRLWAPGDHPAARRLAKTHRLNPVRTLLIMARALDDTLPQVDPPDDVDIRAFDPDRDRAGFLAVNARAFAHHPEQGRLDERGFAAKAAEPWFDPAGFFLAVDRSGAILGFHWTKQRGRGVGEVYVIGVDPDAEGRGLAKALLSRGLTHLRAAGCRRVILYVEGDHQRAVGLYERYGFEVSRRDVMYARLLDAET